MIAFVIISILAILIVGLLFLGVLLSDVYNKIINEEDDR